MEQRIGENIRALRKLNNLSQQELADKLGKSAHIANLLYIVKVKLAVLRLLFKVSECKLS